MRFSWLWAVLPFVVVGTTFAEEAVVFRYLEFRDGSVLRLAVVDEDWPVTMILSDGTPVENRLRLSALESFILASEKGFAGKQALLATMFRLGADDFREREKAQAALLQLGPAIRPDLEAFLQFPSDSETQARLRTILAGWPRSKSSFLRTNALFDIFTTKELRRGHLGTDGVLVRLEGKNHLLPRKDVYRLSVAPPPGLVRPPTAAAEPLFRRLGPNEFPPGCLEEDFETGPGGRPLQIGDIIEKLFINKGFVLSTSVTTSYVSVNNFTVTGKSRGLSAATHQPLWEGEITIQFVQPGREDVAAGVTHFGCWVAAVLPRGTALIAYDLHGREVGKIETQTNGHEFLGVQSSTLIHRLKIVPNVQIDRDYTLDDFIFTPPVPYEIRHQEKFTVHLLDGEHLLCSEVSFAKEGIRLQGMPAGLPAWTVPHGRLLRVIGPDREKPSPVPAGIFAELGDGSILFGAFPEGKKGLPVFARRPGLLQDRQQLAGLWHSQRPRQVQAPKDNEIAYLWPLTQEWASYSRVEFLDDGMILTDRMGKHEVGYRDLSWLWLAPPPPQAVPGSWHVRTRQGEDLVIGPPAQVLGKMSQEITMPWQGQALRLSAAEVAALYQVPKN